MGILSGDAVAPPPPLFTRNADLFTTLILRATRLRSGLELTCDKMVTDAGARNDPDRTSDNFKLQPHEL